MRGGRVELGETTPDENRSPASPPRGPLDRRGPGAADLRVRRGLWRRPCSRIVGTLCSPVAHAMRHAVLPARTDRSAQPRTRGTDMAGVYVQTNEANANRLLEFARRDDG